MKIFRIMMLVIFLVGLAWIVVYLVNYEEPTKSKSQDFTHNYTSTYTYTPSKYSRPTQKTTSSQSNNKPSDTKTTSSQYIYKPSNKTHDTYFEGYDRVVDDLDHDEKRYKEDRDYAAGVEDAYDDLGEDGDWEEDDW